MPVTVPPPSPIPPVPTSTPLPENGASSGVSWPWLKWFETIRQRINAGLGIQSINADTTPAQVIKGTGGVTVSTSGGITTVDASAGTAGLASINADTTPAQLLVAGSNVTITDTGGGRHAISSTAAGIVSINGDTTHAQNIAGTGGITVSTTSGTTTISGGGGGGGGIVSINADTTAAQTIIAGANITVTDNGTGGHTIASTAGGTGTVTSFSAGSLSPLFTTSVATASTTPALSFAQVTQAQNLVFAGPTSGTANPAFRALVTADLPANGTVGAVGITIDGGGVAPSIGSKGYVQVPYSCTITGWTMLGDVAGAAQITVKKSTYAGFPTTASIVASAQPKITATSQKATSTTLTGWTTAVTAGDILEFNLDSIATITRVYLALQVTRT